MTPIYNFDNYTDEMKKSLLDKTFFINKIEPVQLIVDYGCGDGMMVDFLSTIFPKQSFMIWDEDPNMMKLATIKNAKNFNISIIKAHRSDAFHDYVRDVKSTKALVLSSVLHEMYSYSDGPSIDAFWKWVYECNFEYIIIRDMAFSATGLSATTDVANIFRFGKKKQIESFESTINKPASSIWNDMKIYHNIENLRDMYHFLLKYRYTDNWEREVKENYFAATEGILNMTIPHQGYGVLYADRYTPQFIKDSVFKDFKIKMEHPTHINLILKKRK